MTRSLRVLLRREIFVLKRQNSSNRFKEDSLFFLKGGQWKNATYRSILEWQKDEIPIKVSPKGISYKDIFYAGDSGSSVFSLLFSILSF